MNKLLILSTIIILGTINIIRGEIAIGAELFILMIPILIIAVRYQIQKEEKMKRYQKLLLKEEREKKLFLDDLRREYHGL